jgi:eukaryotic-like serine/threonine-protein kinase
MIGQEVGHYRVLSRLGAGGMGEVYLAEDLKLGRKVALKVLSSALASQRSQLERFQREARSVAALNHPNIVTIYSVEQAEDLHFFTMELLEGHTLAALLPEDGFALRRLLEIALPLCDALEVAHEHGIVHRDLKPENVMMSGDGRLKVLDFGIARPAADHEETVVEGAVAGPLHSLTEPGRVVGTMPYMSPEQVQGSPLDRRTDLFSLGVLLYELATGRRPFPGTGAELIVAILRDQPPPPSLFNRQLPEGLDQIVARCLKKSSAERYATAAEIRRDLVDLVETGDKEEVPAEKPPLALVAPTAGLSAVHPLTWTPRTWIAVTGFIAACLVSVPLLSRLQDRDAAPAARSMPPGLPSLAVLPLDNLSGEPEYFVDGMTDALISSLGNVRGVRVISRQSVMRFKDSDQPLPDIARELGVEMILEGAVLRAQGRVRITAQLFRAAPEQQLWSETYERAMRDVLSLQGELARDIAEEIEVKLNAQERRLLTRERPVAPAVLEAYLQGRYFSNQFTPDSYRKAIQQFNHAIDLDPAYAPAHAGLADTYSMLGYSLEEPGEFFQRAQASAREALRLDPDLVEAHGSLGLIELVYHWNWSAAEKEFRRAIELNPSSAMAHARYWTLLAVLGRTQEAREQIQAAQARDPLSLILSSNAGLDFLLAGDYPRAYAQLDQALSTNPDFIPAYLNRWEAFNAQGREAEAYRDQVKALRLIGYPEAAAAAEKAYPASGYRGALRAAARSLIETSRQRYVVPSQIGTLFAVAGDQDQAMEWLEKSFARRSPALIWIEVSPSLRGLKGNPRFQDLVRRIGLPAQRGGT